MKLLFTKGTGKTDTLEVVRPDHRRELISCPKQRILPHDMMHFAVEQALGVRGFLTRVHEGEAASFVMETDAMTDAVERLVEVFQGDAWSGGQTPPPEMLDLYAVTCRARGCAALPVDEAAIVAVREHIRALTARWDAVPVGGTLELTL